jgi:hypothetical protein
MPQISSGIADQEREQVRRGEVCDWSTDAATSFCHAQALADHDGMRRRVTRGKSGAWWIELANLDEADA